MDDQLAPGTGMAVNRDSAMPGVLWWISRVKQGGIKGNVIAIVAVHQRLWSFVQTRDVGR
jgi:hypothetical protein